MDILRPAKQYPSTTHIALKCCLV